MSSCPNNQSLVTSSGQPTAVVFWTNPEARDNSEETPTVTCSVESGSEFRIGENEVICDALDASGNQATCSFHVTMEGNNFSLCCCFCF